jgi:signal transduction histidine kinase
MKQRAQLFIGCLLCCATAAIAQSKRADSLTALLQQNAPDTLRIKRLNWLSEELSDKLADSSLQCAMRALDLSKRVGYVSGIGTSLNNIGWAYYRKGDFSKGFDYSLQGLRINDSIGILPQLAVSYRNIGAIFNSQAKYKESIEYFHRELNIYRQLNNKEAIGRCLNNIAFTSHLGQFRDSALVYGYAALEHSTRLNAKYLMSFALRTLGDIYFKDGDINRSIEYFTASAAAARETNSNFIIETALYRLGKAYQAKKEWKKTIPIFEEAIAVAGKLGAKSEQATIYRLVAISYDKIGDHANAYKAEAASARLNDTLYEERNRTRFAQMQVQFDTEKKQSEINLLKKEDQLQDQKIREQRLYTLLLLAVMGLLIALWLIAWRRNQYKQLLNEQLRLQKLALEEASFQKDKIFSILSHDLRLPIASLTTVLNIVEKQGMSEDAFAKIKAALYKQIGALNLTLDNLLLWSRNQMEGVANIQPERINLHDIIAQNIHVLLGAAGQKKILLNNETPALLFAWADAQHIDIVIRNLLLNALKFTPEGGYVNISSAETDQELTIRVTDTGVGMTEEQMGKLFRINTHFTTVGTRNEKGAGLGLLLCKEFVEANGGKLLVSSEPGNGSTFSFTLPKKDHGEKESV